MKDYYDARATEYDEWYLGRGRFEHLERVGWDAELRELEEMLARLPPKRTLDVACGTGFLTRRLQGRRFGIDQSARMLGRARAQAPSVSLVRGDALALPFAGHSFDRVFTGHFYGHLEEPERIRFLKEVRRVAPELVVADAATRPDRPPEEWQERVLKDGTRWRVYKRYFTAGGLVRELGGGDVLLAGRWFVCVRAFG